MSVVIVSCLPHGLGCTQSLSQRLLRSCPQEIPCCGHEILVGGSFLAGVYQREEERWSKEGRMREEGNEERRSENRSEDIWERIVFRGMISFFSR